MPNPLVLVHGYGSSGAAFSKWNAALQAAGRDVKDISIGNYVTLNNEVNVDDIAHGFDFRLREKGLAGKPFDAIVHSTGMLVMRSWLTASNTAQSRRGQLQHLVGLAPATFGSPLAAKGRSLLGRIFMGNKDPGPDFLDSGDLVLGNLELGSEYTWNLAHRDLINTPLYGPNNDTPYVFIFDGTSDYGTLAEIFLKAEQEGTDGVVRWSGVALNTRKITLNLGVPKGSIQSPDWGSTLLDIPLIPVPGLNHNQIMSEPPQELIDLVLKALQVNSKDDFEKFHQQDVANSELVQRAKVQLDKDQWQQFVVHAMDSRGDGITDYSVEIVAKGENDEVSLAKFEEDVHPYAADTSFRCFHVRLTGLKEKIGARKLFARIIASTGTKLVSYQGYGSGKEEASPEFGPVDLDLSDYDGTQPGKPSIFYPFTTTLIEIILNREPAPPVDIFTWLPEG